MSGPNASRGVHAPLWLLALATFSGTLGMHIFVPALPSAAADLGTGIAAMQTTISLYILGVVAQISFAMALRNRRRD